MLPMNPTHPTPPRRWLLALLATRPGHRLLQAALAASLATTLSAPILAAGELKIGQIPNPKSQTPNPYSNPAVQNALHQLGLNAPSASPSSFILPPSSFSSDQFQVNSYTSNPQTLPAVALDSNGDFVVVWQSEGSNSGLPADTDLNSIQGQRYNSSGTPVGSQFQVNSYTTGQQGYPDVAMDSDGDFVVVWHSYGSYGGDPFYSIQGQRYNSSGAPVGSQFQINNLTGNFFKKYSAVAMDNDGDFVVVWTSDGISGSDNDQFSVQGRRYDSSGVAQGGQFLVNSYTTNAQFFSSVAMDSSGNFVVTWESRGSDTGSPADTSQESIQAQRYDSSGAPVSGQFQVNSYTTNSQRSPDVAADSDGNFVIVWESFGGSGDSSGSIEGQRYDSSGAPLGGQFQVNSYTTNGQLQPAVSMDSDGDFVIVWASYGSDSSDTDGFSIRGRAFSKGGLPLWGEFQANSYTTNLQSSPAVALDSNGDFAIVWQSNGSSGSDNSLYSVQARQFDLGQMDHQVNSYSTGSQRDPAVAIDSDGDFVVVWQSDGSPSPTGTDTHYYSIQAQRYQSSGQPAGSQFQVNSYTTHNQLRPAVAMDSNGDFVVVWDSAGSNSDPSGLSVQGQRYDSSGGPVGSQFQISTATTGDQFKPAVSMDSNGDFVVVWESYSSSGSDNSAISIQGQRYDSSGAPAGGEFQVNSYTTGNQLYPAVSMDSDGDFVVVWGSYISYSYGDDQDFSVQGQRYNSAGTPQGSQFQVNTYTTREQGLPAIASDSDGDFVVVWMSYGSNSDPSFTSIQGQRFNSSGGPVGSQFQVNSYTTGYQLAADVSLDSDGDFVVVWQSYGSYSGNDYFYAIEGQRYNSAGAVQGSNFQVNAQAFGIQFISSVALDSNGDFVVAWDSNAIFQPPFAPFSQPSRMQAAPSPGFGAPEDDMDWGIAAARFTAEGGPQPTAITLQSAALPTPRSTLPLLATLLTTLTALLTAVSLRFRRQ
jgi:hypothetical protein